MLYLVKVKGSELGTYFLAKASVGALDYWHVYALGGRFLGTFEKGAFELIGNNYKGKY